VGDIVGKQQHLTDPAWLLRLGVYLELLTCLGIVEAVRDEPGVGDLLTPEERAAFDASPVYKEIRRRIDPEAWREVWGLRRITFPGLSAPRTGPVSARNLLTKKRATMRFLHVHHEDLKHAIELAGPNRHNAQETWHRVFRDAERAVLRQTAAAFPELAFLPGPVRELVLWQRRSIADQQGLYATACVQYRASMNSVADWAKARGLMDHAGAECITREVSLLEAHSQNPDRVAALQRRDGYGPRLDVTEPAEAVAPTTAEVEALLATVPILRMLSADDIHGLAETARPLLLGPTERLVVQGEEGNSLFLVADGSVEVLLGQADGSEVSIEVMDQGEVVGEMALLTGERRGATVRAVDGAVVYEIGHQQYEPLLRAHPEWVDELATVMEERLARRAVRLADVGVAGAGRAHLRDRIRRRFFG
jgi:CRP-like cAMP-binding protein